MESGALVTDEIVVGIIKDAIKSSECRRGFILDDFPRTSSQLNLYLLAFNDVSCAGWAYVLYLTVTTIFKALEGGDLDWSQVAQITWDVVSLPLTVIQPMAVMEIVYDAVGFVRYSTSGG
ncbi:unnamed protein product [Hyaloperonospora brassicae]|uniref:Very-long-chain (3R)-3-hydroxyacyl-CoA dehydratase n=1 Tax=Hyaloperonospora brassicae TaxID=162125 RepID=A0AAV0TLB4_HYABA|nr:unnamed protein product [Hyaloperonospora brassicae]